MKTSRPFVFALCLYTVVLPFTFVTESVAAPAGLQGAFVPIAVDTPISTSSGTTFPTTMWSRTTDGADLYVSKDIAFTPAEMQPLHANMSTQPTRNNGMCTELAAADISCSSNFPYISTDPSFFSTQNGLCWASVSGAVVPNYATIPWSSCVSEVKIFMDSVRSTYPNIALGTPTCETINSGHTYGAGKGRWRVNVTGAPWGQAAWFDANATCSGQPLTNPEPSGPATATDVQTAVAPSVTNQWIMNTDNSVISNNTVINNASTAVTNSYNTYVSNYVPGTGVAPSGYLPDLPSNINPSPAPDTGTGEGTDQCELNPATVGCANADGFIADFLGGLSDLLVGDFDFNAPIEGEGDLLPSEDFGDVVYSPVAIASSSGCPTPPTFEYFGQTKTINNELVCEGLSSVSPVILLLATLSAMYIISGAYRSKT